MCSVGLTETVMRLFGNLLWLVLAGWWLAIAYVVAGVANCLTIIGIPFGIQSFKLAGYALWPFGRVVVRNPSSLGAVSLVGNILWFFLGGIWLALAHVLAGLLLIVTIVGIPLGVASIKLAGLALFPFGKQIVSADATAGAEVVQRGPEPIR